MRRAASVRAQSAVFTFEWSPERPYIGLMDTTPRDNQAASAWAEILAESEAEAEAGLFVSGDDLLRELHESIARMEKRGVKATAGGNQGR